MLSLLEDCIQRNLSLDAVKASDIVEHIYGIFSSPLVNQPDG